MSSALRQIQAIVEGRHRDAFSVLGPHESEIRAWLPRNARSLGHRRRSRDPDDAGASVPAFSSLSFPKHAGEYRLLAGAYEFDDPYRFPPLLTSFELYLHGEGTNYESYKTLGAHSVKCEGVDGVRFAVWAPNAEVVSVIGDFNRWDRTWHPMRLRDGGIWEIFIPGLTEGANYKYSVLSRTGDEQQKADPYALLCRNPAQDRVRRLEPVELHVVRRRMAGIPRRPRVVPRTRFLLRSAS